MATPAEILHEDSLDEMFDVDEITRMQADWVARWHSHPIENPYEGFWGLVCHEHRCNFELWHQEDQARDPRASADEIAQVKLAIDRLNQERNDAIERLDDWLTSELSRLQIVPQKAARLNTETPGSAIDRLSIMALRIFHYQEQLSRKDQVSQSHRQLVAERLALCIEQSIDLSQSLKELLEAIRTGERRHKTYRQMKMYNHPELNPVLYGARNSSHCRDENA